MMELVGETHLSKRWPICRRLTVVAALSRRKACLLALGTTPRGPGWVPGATVREVRARVAEAQAAGDPPPE